MGRAHAGQALGLEPSLGRGRLCPVVVGSQPADPLLDRVLPCGWTQKQFGPHEGPPGQGRDAVTGAGSLYCGPPVTDVQGLGCPDRPAFVPGFPLLRASTPSSHPAVGLPSQGRGRQSWDPCPPVAGRGRETRACPAYHPSKANVVSPLSQPPGPWQRAVGISLAAVRLAVSQRASPGLPPAAGGGRAHPLCVPASPGGRLLVGVCGPLSGPPLPGHWSREQCRESGGRPQGLGWALATGGPRAEAGWARMAWAWQLREHWPQTNCPAGSERFRARLRSHSTAVCTGVTEGVSPEFRISRPAPPSL